MKRDPKGLYRKAVAGELKNFTGINSPYDLPENPDVILDTERAEPHVLAGELISWLDNRGYLRL
jgi:adenylylsulfate kinase-like enzyme